MSSLKKLQEITEKKRSAFRTRGKSATSTDSTDPNAQVKKFLTIGPALPNVPTQTQTTDTKTKTRQQTINKSGTSGNLYDFLEDGKLLPGHPVLLQTTSDGKVHASRAQKEKERYPDRISLDRRGLSVLPIIDGEPRLRLLSMQHNLLTKLDGLHAQNFIHLVFLDIYDNQLDRISSMESLISLRVLLMGKNRIRRIEGLKTLTKLEVLDLHGNRLLNLSGLQTLTELKVLNVAGNQIKVVGVSDLKGLKVLREANLRRNKIRKLLGFAETPALEKLFLSNNDLQSVEDMSSLAKAVSMKEITIDNNPVSLGGDCVSFLVSYLPNLNLISGMQITDQVRKAAMAWRHNKELSNSTFMDLTSDVCSNIRREEVISNARTNWELLRSQTKCLTSCSTNTYFKDLRTDCDLVIAPSDLVIDKGKRRRSFSLKRSQSQDTENSQNTSSSNSSDYLRLPPILGPMINNLEKLESRNAAATMSKTPESSKPSVWDLASSTGPNIDSSASSLPSSSENSDDECSVGSNRSATKCTKAEKDELPKVLTKFALSTEPELKITPSPLNTTDNASVISTGNSSTTSTGTSANTVSSFGESVCSKAGTVRSRSSQRTVKSAVPVKKNINHRLNLRAVTAKPKTRKNCQASPTPSVPSKDREQGSDYLAEICGRFLNIFGQGALRYIDRPWNTEKANDVNTVKFTYVNFNGITSILTKLKNRFPNAENFIFVETNIYCLGQINALAEVQGLYSLEIQKDGNPIVEKNWRSYAIFRLSHWGLKMINNIEVTEEEITKANEEYKSLSDLIAWCLPDTLLQPLLQRLQLENNQSESQLSPKRWLLSADPALRSVVSKEALQWHRGAIPQEDLMWRQKARTQFGILIDNTCEAIEKLKLLEKEWDTILLEIVKSTLKDYSHMNTYMKDRMNELK